MGQAPYFPGAMAPNGSDGPTWKIPPMLSTISSALKGAVSRFINSGSPVVPPGDFIAGTVLYFPGVLGNLPAGFLHCDGSYVLQAQYPALYAVIGTMYGTTDINSNFRLPLYDGYFLRFCDFGSGLDPDYATRTDRGDGQVGAAVGTVQQHAILAHTHVVRTPAVVGGSIGLTTRGAHTNAYGTAGASTGVGVENRPKNINMYAVIKI